MKYEELLTDGSRLMDFIFANETIVLNKENWIPWTHEFRCINKNIVKLMKMEICQRANITKEIIDSIDVS